MDCYDKFNIGDNVTEQRIDCSGGYFARQHKLQ